MLSLGGVCQRKGQFLAKVDTFDAGTRYYIVGPPRGDDEQQAYQDLCYIRAVAEDSPTRVQGLQAMQTAAKLLRDEAKALARGGIWQDSAENYYARYRYADAGITKKKILGPPRQGERRAESDLAILREAARGKETWPEQVAAMQQAAQDLREKAQFENRVARGVRNTTPRSKRTKPTIQTQRRAGMKTTERMTNTTASTKQRWRS